MWYRVAVLSIVGFWLWMTGQLVHQELVHDDRRLLPVPVSYVWQLVFRREEPSSLVLYHGQHRLGTLNVQPRHEIAGNVETRRLTISGSFAMETLALTNQRLVLHGVFDLDPQGELQRLEVALGIHQPKDQTSSVFVLDGCPATNHWHYAYHQGGTVVKEASGAWPRVLDDPDLRLLGISPEMIAQLGRHQASSLHAAASHGTLRVNGEEIETYLVTIRQDGDLETTIHLNQLGQILAVKTFFGYALFDEAYLP